jgi:hypothetical protein
MINRSRTPPSDPPPITRDERSMRVLEYAMALVALAAAILLTIR